MKSLGIDYGDTRIGVSVSDDIGMIARPLTTIVLEEGQTPEDAISIIAELITEHEAEVLVIGHPLRMDGTAGTAADKVEAWVELILEEHPDLDIELIDERLTTIEAEQKLADAGKKLSAKDKKEVLDQYAATIILQDFLDNGGDSAITESAGSRMAAGGGKDIDLTAFAVDDDDEFVDEDEDEFDDEDEDEFGDEDEDEFTSGGSGWGGSFGDDDDY
jgi:putative holliday junction resolvase